MSAVLQVIGGEPSRPTVPKRSLRHNSHESPFMDAGGLSKGVKTHDPTPVARRRRGMRINRLLIPGLLLLGCLVVPVDAGHDFEDDAFARLVERPGLLPDHAFTPVAASDPIWMPIGESTSFGVFGAHLESTDHRHRAPPQTTIGLVTAATPWGRPADLLGVSLTIEDPLGGLLTDIDPRTTALTAFYGWRITPDLVLQPGITWSSDRAGPADRLTALLAMRIEF